jgi:fatty-acyl-CoA synthase
MSEPSYSRGPATPLVDLTLSEALAQTATRFPDREALVSRQQNLRYTWQELDAEVTRVARGLAGLGLQPQDRVGIWSPNCAEWILLQYACARAGFVLVNVNPAYRSHDLRFVLRKSGMRALFLPERDARSEYRQILEEVRAPEQALEHVVYLGTTDWDRMLAAGRDLPRDPVSPDDATNIQYTSGTTGSPKGVLLTHRSLVNNALATGGNMQIDEKDRMCVGVPMYHCAGCVCSVLNAVIHGSTILFPSGAFDPLAMLETIQQEKATILMGVPTMYIAQLQHPEFARFDVSSLRGALIGGAPCPVELLRRITEDFHCRDLAVVYGQTEASPLITMHGPGDTPEQRSATVGRVMPNTEVKVVNSAGEIVPRGEVGELCARGYLIMAGYDQEPEATARAIDPDGWLHTGDLAVMRDDGHVNIRGRSKEMIIRGGENIYPAEIENFLFTHPNIGDVAVVGLPDLKWGEVVAAWIRPKPGQSLTPEEVRDYCQGKIAHFKIPQHIRIVEAFPMTVTGKVQKFKIRQEEIASLGLSGQIAATA